MNELIIDYYKDREFKILDDKSLYETITEIFINGGGSVFSLPPSLKNFKKLKKLTIDTSRGFDLNCINIPPSIEYLDIGMVGNLFDTFFDGFDKLINLKVFKIELDYYGIFNDYDYDDETGNILYEFKECDDTVAIPNLKNLKEIYLSNGCSRLRNYNPKDILKHSFMDNIREKVKDVIIEDCDYYIYIHILL